MDTMRISSADGKSALYTVISRPEKPVAALHLIHGFAEHIGRYEHVIEFFTRAGFLVSGNDHIGHGRSAAREEDLSDFGSFDALEPLLTDEVNLARRLREELPPGTPLYLLGHSMGSLMGRALLYREPELYDAAVIMGTGDMPPLLTGIFAGILGVYKLLGKGSLKSPFLNQMAIGKNNQAFQPTRTSCDWLSVNQENVDRYLADPLSGQPGSVHTFAVMNQLMAEIRRPANLERMNQDLPVFFVAGAEDAFGDFSKGVHVVAELFRKAGMKQIQEKFYENSRHEILNEECAPAVLEDLLQFYTSVSKA